MRILTLAMQVPDSRATLKLASDGKALETSDLKLVCNPFDEFAIEQAIRFREAGLAIDEIVVATIGDAGSAQALRSGLAIGADRGLHIVHDDLPMHDEILLASLLAEAIRLEPTPFDLILCGKQTIDNDAGILGPALAEFLDLPHIGAVVKLEMAADGSSVHAHRRIEGAEEVFQMPLPALITCEKGLVEARFPTLPNLMKAKKKPVTTLTEADLPALAAPTPGLEVLSLTPPAPRPPCTMIDGDPAEMARELARCLHEEAKVL